MLKLITTLFLTLSVVTFSTANNVACVLTNPCANGGTCTPTGASWFSCTCPSPFSGSFCTIQDLNSKAYATNETTALPSTTIADTTFETTAQTLATITDTTFETTAQPTPTIAQAVSNTTSNATCNDFHSNPCMNGGSCLDIQGRFICLCSGPWTGTTCDTALPASPQTPSPPTQSTVYNNTTSKAQASSQAPSVPTQSTVSNTTSNTTCDDFHTNPCMNGGSCLDIQGRFICLCSGPWTGTTCDTALPASPQTPSPPTQSTVYNNTTSKDAQQSQNVVRRRPRRRRFRQSGGSSSEEN